MTTQDPVVDYASWTAPESSLTVVYSLPLFHEIDFVVNEGYRRIPHGGLEVGGILFGRKLSDSVQIEAFRSIDCEHSTGPSFVLSTRDIEKLEEQLRGAAADPDLQELIPVGWFISHSRGELVLFEREGALVEKFFPRPYEVTVLVKPIKFQPTRFAFLTRDAQGKLRTDGREQAIILPLPGRSSRASVTDPTPSIAAPTDQSEEAVAPAAPPKQNLEREPLPPPPPEKDEPVPAPQMLATQIRPTGTVVDTKPSPSTKVAMPHAVLTPAVHRPPAAGTARAKSRGLSLLLSIGILLFAAALGFGVGYFAYSRLSFSPIPLTVEDHPPFLFVSWPAAESRDADSAFLRIDDGPPRPLTPQEKIGGQAEIKVSASAVKIEILTHSWLHDSRGIVRYIRPAEPVPSSSTDPISAVAP